MGQPLPTTPIVLAKSVGYLPSSWSVTQTGQFTYSIPVDLAAGRGGMQPSLSLKYSSSSGNGLLGVGWMLSGLSLITRCEHTLSTEGFVDGVDFHDANDAQSAQLRDRFCLDGEKLVAIRGDYGADGTEYRTENTPYAKIVSSITNARQGQGPDQFTVKTRNGSIRTYQAMDAPQWKASLSGFQQIDNKHDQWLMVREADRSGNYIDYSYTTFSDGAQGVQHLPQRIDYTRHTSPSNSYRSVTLYEDRKDHDFGWRAGVRSTLIKRLKSITISA